MMLLTHWMRYSRCSLKSALGNVRCVACASIRTLYQPGEHVHSSPTYHWFKVACPSTLLSATGSRKSSYVLCSWQCLSTMPDQEPVAVNRATQVVVHEAEVPSTLGAVHTCSGCGAPLQSKDPKKLGFIPGEKLAAIQSGLPDSQSRNEDDSLSNEAASSEDGDSNSKAPSPVVCMRCFSLKHYNTALNVTLKADDYLVHLSHLRDKRALILLMIDVVDFPGSLFPRLNTLIPQSSPVMIVANKVDLLPKTPSPSQFLERFESIMKKECLRTSLAGCRIADVHFVCAKSGTGVEELTEAILRYWGNRGDVYLLGCTNVGKSTLFSKLLVTLCGARPGDLTTASNVSAPAPTVSRWPGTTLGLLSFPIMSLGKRKRLIAQYEKRERAEHFQFHDDDDHDDHDDRDDSEMEFDDSGDGVLTPEQARQMMSRAEQETEDVLMEIGIRRQNPKSEPEPSKECNRPPQNRCWLHDTPGAINDAQLINLLTSKELNLALPKKALKPKTFILQPGQTLLLGGLARLDYTSGPVSAYFTVFAASYLPVHMTRTIKADDVYRKNLGTALLKIPFGSTERLQQFTELQFQDLSITGTGWRQSAADVVLSSAGWVAVTGGPGQAFALRAYTPGGRGIYCREPALLPDAVNERGKRSQKGNRAAFTGRKKM